MALRAGRDRGHRRPYRQHQDGCLRPHASQQRAAAVQAFPAPQVGRSDLTYSVVGDGEANQVAPNTNPDGRQPCGPGPEPAGDDHHPVEPRPHGRPGTPGDHTKGSSAPTIAKLGAFHPDTERFSPHLAGAKPNLRLMQPIPPVPSQPSFLSCPAFSRSSGERCSLDGEPVAAVADPEAFPEGGRRRRRRGGRAPTGSRRPTTGDEAEESTQPSRDRGGRRCGLGAMPACPQYRANSSIAA